MDVDGDDALALADAAQRSSSKTHDHDGATVTGSNRAHFVPWRSARRVARATPPTDSHCSIRVRVSD